jgi:lipopolysaccharide biosynthesis protein
MHQVLTEADETFEQAEVTIAEAVERRLIMAEQEETLQKANTPLIESRALQHNVNLDEIQAKADESIELSQQAQASAKEALRDLDTRYVGMGVAVVVIVLTIIALVLIKRELDRDLEAKRARRRGDSPTTTSQS